MSKKKYESIAFCESTYEGYNEYLGRNVVDYDEMYSDISSFIRMAIKNGYQMKIWYDGLTVSIEYEYQDESMSGVCLEWLNEDECAKLNDITYETFREEQSNCENCS